jgi:predicted nucleic acid-binding protein
MVYADSSVLVSLVMRDSNSDSATEMMVEGGRKLVFSKLLELEVGNAIRLAVGMGRMNEVEGMSSQRRMESFRSSGTWLEVELDWLRVFGRAMGLSRGHSSVMKSRSLDILHVASAMENGAKTFWSFDDRQRQLAEAVGLRINP